MGVLTPGGRPCFYARFVVRPGIPRNNHYIVRNRDKKARSSGCMGLY